MHLERLQRSIAASRSENWAPSLVRSGGPNCQQWGMSVIHLILANPVASFAEPSTTTQHVSELPAEAASFERGWALA